MNEVALLKFDQPGILGLIDALDDAELDALDYGVIAFDATTAVRRYNRFESEIAGLGLQRVLGFPLFTAVAPCMNNYLVAQRFEDAASAGTTLDVLIDYVFTLRMRPSKVVLRLLSSPRHALSYVLVERRK